MCICSEVDHHGDARAGQDEVAQPPGRLAVYFNLIVFFVNINIFIYYIEHLMLLFLIRV